MNLCLPVLIISSLYVFCQEVRSILNLLFLEYWVNRKRNVFALGSNDCNSFQPDVFGFSDFVIAKLYCNISLM